MPDTNTIIVVSGGGASGARFTTATNPIRLLRLWCALVCILAVVSTTSYQVSAAAESKVDSDLVFDNLEQTDVKNHENHHRIARNVINEEIPLDSSPPVEEEHWLSSTVNRIKRSISSFLSKSPEEGDGSSRSSSSSSSSSHSSHSTHKKVKRTRVPRQDPLGQQEAAEDDYDDEEYNEGNVEETESTVDAGGNEEEEEEEEEVEEEYYEQEQIEDDYNEQDLKNVDGQVEENENDDEDDYGPIEQGEPARGDTFSIGQENTPETTTPQFEVTHPVTQTQDVSRPDIESPNIVPVTYDGISRTGGDHSFNFNYNNTNYASGNRHNESQIGFDDEDLTAVNSGEGTSGDGEEPIHHTPGMHPPPQNHPVYFRISFTVSEPFVDAFNDRNSFQYQDFTRDLIQDIENLYKNVPGTQSATVIRIEKREADAFTSKVTVDLGSVGFYNHQTIKDVLYKQIENHRRIGDHTALPDDFQFRVFEAHTRVCQSHELRCHSGECVPAEARCNRVSDCSDNSDEVGCEQAVSTSTATPWSISPEVDLNGGDFGSGDGEGRSVRPEHTKCRADDVVRCSDGSRTICADHVCDGKKDCDDGSDEDNCSNDCAEGEFICDISRCIPLSKRCDGVRDCSDDTDERECAQCRRDELKCDNKCVRHEKRCDGVRDCNDGADERNCPPVLESDHRAVSRSPIHCNIVKEENRPKSRIIDKQKIRNRIYYETGNEIDCGQAQDNEQDYETVNELDYGQAQGNEQDCEEAPGNAQDHEQDNERESEQENEQDNEQDWNDIEVASSRPKHHFNRKIEKIGCNPLYTEKNVVASPKI